MKRFILAMLLPVVAFAQTPVTIRPNSFSLEVRPLASSSKKGTNERYSNGSFEKSGTSERRIAVSLRYTGAESSSVALRCYWIGKKPGSSDRVLIARHERPVTLTAKEPAAWEETSGAVTMSDTNLASLNQRQTTGAKLDGWVVTATGPDGALLAVRASDAGLDALGRTPGALDALPKMEK